MKELGATRSYSPDQCKSQIRLLETKRFPRERMSASPSAFSDPTPPTPLPRKRRREQSFESDFESSFEAERSFFQIWAGFPFHFPFSLVPFLHPFFSFLIPLSFCPLHFLSIFGSFCIHPHDRQAETSPDRRFALLGQHVRFVILLCLQGCT